MASCKSSKSCACCDNVTDMLLKCLQIFEGCFEGNQRHNSAQQALFQPGSSRHEDWAQANFGSTLLPGLRVECTLRKLSYLQRIGHQFLLRTPCSAAISSPSRMVIQLLPNMPYGILYIYSNDVCSQKSLQYYIIVGNCNMSVTYPGSSS